jgi:hypothetical protein
MDCTDISRLMCHNCSCGTTAVEKRDIIWEVGIEP